MDWNSISAIGTALAALVGVADIWLNLWKKRKRLSVNFHATPPFKLFISNTSYRSIMIVKLIYSVNGHEFYTEYFEGENEVCLLPATSRILYISQDDLRA